MDVRVLDDGKPEFALERCPAYGLPAVSSGHWRRANFAALQGGGLAAQGKKDPALLRLFRGQVSQRRIGLGPRSSMQVPRQNFARKIEVHAQKLKARRLGWRAWLSEVWPRGASRDRVQPDP
jgi:hypothetical protein